MTPGTGPGGRGGAAGAATAQVRAVFLGPPGAGKGTQAQQLTAARAILHISTGEMLREQARQGTELGRKAKEFMDGGALVPDDLIIAMVATRIAEPDAARGWILDGFPRTLPQAEALDRELAGAGKAAAAGQRRSGLPLTHVLYFAVPEPALVRRLSGRWTCPECGTIWNTESKPPKVAGICDRDGATLTQRADDRPDAVKNRLRVYREQTAPLLDFYRASDRLTEVDADRPPDEIQANVTRLLGLTSRQ
jgi:adenylate kinase